MYLCKTCLYESTAKQMRYTIDFSKKKLAAIRPQTVDVKCNMVGEIPVECVELLSSSFLSFSSSKIEKNYTRDFHKASAMKIILFLS